MPASSGISQKTVSLPRNAFRPRTSFLQQAMELFKYTDEKGIAIIRDLTIKVSKASEFNDPFELCPMVDPSPFTRRMIRQHLIDRPALEREFERQKLNGYSGTRKTFRKEYLRRIPALVDATYKDVPRRAEALRRDFPDKYCVFWRIFCLSKGFKSILMWSHYANKHKGMVVGLDCSHKALEALPYPVCFPVEYKNEKAKFVLDPASSDQFLKSILPIAQRKSPDWAYEEEYRFVLPAPQGGGHLYSIDPKQVLRVIVGARATEGFVSEVVAILKRPHFSHVKLERAFVSDDKFELEFRPII